MLFRRPLTFAMDSGALLLGELLALLFVFVMGAGFQRGHFFMRVIEALLEIGDFLFLVK